MSGDAILAPVMCRKCGAYVELYQNCNAHREKLQDVKRREPKNPIFSQTEYVAFRNSGQRFSISMQLDCEVQNRRISPVFRKKIWSFFAMLSAEAFSKWSVARQISVCLVNLYSTSDENKLGKQR